MALVDRIADALCDVQDRDLGVLDDRIEVAEAIAAVARELVDALTDARDVNMMLRDSIKKLRAENQRLRDQLHAVPSAIRAYAGGELDGYSYHGDGSAIEALRRISRHAENIRDYAATRQETTVHLPEDEL